MGADDVLRDLFKRGKYPDVILPMFVLRRLDGVLEPIKKAVLETKAMLDNSVNLPAYLGALQRYLGTPFPLDLAFVLSP